MNQHQFGYFFRAYQFRRGDFRLRNDKILRFIANTEMTVPTKYELRILHRLLAIRRQKLVGRLIHDLQSAGKAVSVRRYGNDSSNNARTVKIEALNNHKISIVTERKRLAELKNIEAAFMRIENGTYGQCTICAGRIFNYRLELNPTIAICIDCADRRPRLISG